MALSDQLLKLSAQAAQLETSANAIKNNDEAKIKQRKADLSAAIELTRSQLADDLITASDAADLEWASDKADIAKSFDRIRHARAARHTRWASKRADHAADVAEEDALDDIDFAIYAIQEAEYSILDAVGARADATLKASAIQ